MHDERQAPAPLVDLAREPPERQAEVDELALRERVPKERVHVVVLRLILALELLAAVAHAVEVDLHLCDAVGRCDEAERPALDERLLCLFRYPLCDGEGRGRADFQGGFGRRGGRGGMAKRTEGAAAARAGRRGVRLACVGGLALDHRAAVCREA